ncbi:hypothetical protein ACFXPA_43305 [Amycolatopsis sp. NPDC059090]|uniref:hypothetical protein n=1 Tax=unclassified Amycolatopsis TaxID=2618356 RepID=UPI00366C52DE
MKFTDFEDGFRFELANREFARISMTLLASRAAAHELGPFFAGYARLEAFSAPRYRAAAERLSIRYRPNLRTRARGWLTGHTSKPLLRELLRIAYPRTVEYAEDLRCLAASETPGDFLDYLVRQEDLQVRMMHAALIGNASDVPGMVEEFISGWDS